MKYTTDQLSIARRWLKTYGFEDPSLSLAMISVSTGIRESTLETMFDENLEILFLEKRDGEYFYKPPTLTEVMYGLMEDMGIRKLFSK